ncbi:ligase-associated DNA damage response endonuclease PdeM [bacterium]|nr:ligase-associated DNA damage response endonuclease PdeM [bacterium]
MTQLIQFANKKAELHAPGLIWFPEIKLMGISDIHFEKGSFFGRFGSFLPPYDTASTLEQMEQAIERFQPDTMVALGDSFHDVHATDRLREEDRQRLQTLIDQVRDWIWIEGNHDPAICNTIPGLRCRQYIKDDLHFRHIATGDDLWEISGHYHPKARLSIKGHRMSGACFVKSGRKLIMPAFGAYTGGLDIDSAAFTTAIPQQNRDVYFIHQQKVYAV